MIREFDIYQKEDLRFYRRALTIFENIQLYPIYPDPLVLTENHATNPKSEEIRIDRHHFDHWQTKRIIPPKFTQLSSSDRNSYLTLWIQSPLTYKKLFYHASKSLIYAAIYAQPEFYTAIGYHGPLLEKEKA